MFAPTQLGFVQSTFDASSMQPAFAGQQSPFWGDLSNVEPFGLTAPVLEPAYQGAADLDEDASFLDDIEDYLHLLPSQGVGAPEVAHIPQAVPGAQPLLSTFESLLQSPVVVPSQLFFAPRLNFSAQPTLRYSEAVPDAQPLLSTFEFLPQPPMGVPSQPTIAPIIAPQPALGSQSAIQPALALQPSQHAAASQSPASVPASTSASATASSSEPTPITQTSLLPGYAEEQATKITEKLILFRLNQKHNHLVRKLGTALRPYSRLGLNQTMSLEYQAVLKEGIPLFVSKQQDWDAAFGLLGEAAFHVFHRKELEKAEKAGCTLPALDSELATYINFFPPHEEIMRRFHELQGAAGADSDF
ncbi:hypothetical protein ACGC1H_005144 [Rhizoctonia solani]